MATMSIDMLRGGSLCEGGVSELCRLVGSTFNVRDAVNLYVGAGNDWTDIPRAYQDMVNRNILPGVGLIYKISGIAFRVQPDSNAHLRVYADLHAGNVEEARRAAAAAAYAAAYAATYDAAYDATAARVAAVKSEIIEMIISEIERNFAG